MKFLRLEEATMEGQYHGSDYDSDAFDMVGFLKDVYGNEALRLRPFTRDVMEDLHVVFQKLNLEENSRQLDFGCGPCIHPAISASRKCSHIVMAEYTSQCREFIMKWLKKEDIGFSWKHMFQYVGQKEGRSAESIEKRTRAAIKDMISCDIESDAILGVAQVAPFDVITTCLCLELACPDHLSYQKTLSRLASHIRPGGYLVISGVLGQSSYLIKGKSFFCLSQNTNDINYALQEAGFEPADWYIHDNESKYIGQHDPLGHFTLAARKRQWHNLHHQNI